MWIPLYYTGQLGLVPKVSTFRGSTVCDKDIPITSTLIDLQERTTSPCHLVCLAAVLLNINVAMHAF